MTPNSAKAGVPRVRVARRRRADVLYRINRLVLYAMMLSYVPAIIGGVAGMVYGAYRLTSFVIQAHQAGRFMPLTALALGVDLFVLIASVLLLFGLLPLCRVGGARGRRPDVPASGGWRTLDRMIGRRCRRRRPNGGQKADKAKGGNWKLGMWHRFRVSY